jgi:cytosine/adenosine deaminase-related metal-dependent hydrolase
MIIRARTVLTMEGPPLENGAVAITGNRIRAVDRFAEIERLPGEEVLDLGEQVLLPGLINAHCHLDYSMMRRAISPPRTFTQWIARINAIKRSLHDEDYVNAIQNGFAELVKWGTTTVLNIMAFPALMPQLPRPPIRAWWFYELIDLRKKPDSILTHFENKDWPGGFGLSPHAPYTVTPELFRLAKASGRLLTTHVAESVDEMQMFLQARGDLYDFMQSIGRDMSDCGHGTPLANLVKNGLIDRDAILVHLNELDAEDIQWLAGAHVVHCPCSHRYFRHHPFPLGALQLTGANICLGTDSLASNDALNLFAEMQALHEAEPWLEPRTLLQMVTTNPARALQRRGELGCLRAGAMADLIALPLAEAPRDVYEAVVQNRKPITWLLSNGLPVS